MKKILAVFTALVLLAGVVAGCTGGKTSDSSSNPLATVGNDISNKEYTVTVDAPDGWESTPGTGAILRYRKGSGDFWVRQSPSSGSVDSEIEYYKSRENTGAYTFAWDNVEDSTVNGMEAKYLKYTVDTGSLQMRYDTYFIKKDASIFIVICLTIPVSDYQSLESDYISLLDSLKITEK